MQSHLKSDYNQIPETKANENALYGYDISYEQFKEILNETNQNKKRFIDVFSVKNSTNVTPDLAYQVESKLDDHIADYLKEYPEYTKRYRREVQSAKRWDIFEISASVLCCIPSYILTCLHLCIPCNNLECGDNWMPLMPCDDNRECSTLFPGCNFFCKPVGNIKDKLADYRHQKQITHEILSKGPNPQQMI